ncbi:MAG: site-specific integrase [Prevotella sp.]|nr:site-specific integrase [Prevotella sp.]
MKKCKFLAYAISEAEHLKEIGRYGVAKNHVSAYRRFAGFLRSIGKHDVSFKQMTPQLLSDFEDWLKSQNVCRNSSSCYLRSLCTIWNKAVREGLTTSRTASGRTYTYENPFAGTYRGRCKTNKRAVDAECIYRVHHLNIESALTANFTKPVGKKLRSHIERLQLSRDLFIFSFCARGMTFVDMAHLRKSNVRDNIITYSRRKTGQRLEVRLEPIMLSIIDRHPSASAYLFPILDDNDNELTTYKKYRNALHLYNKSLREIGQLAGISHLTSYVARHSWATTAREKDLPLPVISQALGHNSLSTTEIYLKSLEENTIDKANQNLLDYVFGNKNKE